MATIVDGEGSESDEEQYVFNLSYVKIGNDNPNVAVNNTRDLIFKGTVVDGVTETQDLLNTPIASEATEDVLNNFSSGYESDLLRRKINEISTISMKNYIQGKIAPISTKIMKTDDSLVNTQLTLQNISTSMKLIEERSSKINTKFHNLVDSDFLPKINNLPQ